MFVFHRLSIFGITLKYIFVLEVKEDYWILHAEPNNLQVILPTIMLVFCLFYKVLVPEKQKEDIADNIC